MNKQTLDKLRFIIPGIMISVTIYYIMNGFGSSTKNPLDNYLFYLLSLFCSVLYYSFNVRDLIWRKIDSTFFIRYISMCFNFIKKDKKIPNPCILCLLRNKDDSIKENFSENRTMFIKFIDTKDILKEKSYQIMLNGCILTSVVDLSIICYVVIIFELIMLFAKLNYDAYILIICAVIIILTPIVVLCLIHKHLNLIKGQMKSIDKEWFNEKEN